MVRSLEQANGGSTLLATQNGLETWGPPSIQWFSLIGPIENAILRQLIYLLTLW